MHRLSLWFLLGLLALSGCAADRDDSRALLARAMGQAPGVLVVGEIHGTNEAPDYFAHLAEYLSKRRRPLVVGLEMPAETVRSGCSTEAAAADIFWTHVRDGRSSEAAWRMLCRLKKLEQVGRIRLFGFAAPRGPGPGHPYAGPIAAVLASSGRALLLVGNYHARRADGSLVRDLADRGVRVLTLTISSGAGTAWTCDRDGTCLARPFKPDFCGNSVRRPAYIVKGWTSPANGALWDGCLAFPSLTASPPQRP
jgi:hypothetical protein